MKENIDNRSVFHFLWQCIDSYTWCFFIISLAPITTSIAWPLFNYAIKMLVDRLSLCQDLAWSDLYLPCGLIIGSELCIIIVWRLSEFMEWKALPSVKKIIFMRAYDYLQHHAYSFFQDEPAGKLAGKVNQLVTGFMKLFGALSGGLFYALLQISTNLFFLCTVEKSLGSLATIWLAVYFVVGYLLAKRLASLAQKEAHSYTQCMGYLTDLITNMPTVLGFGARKKEYASLDKNLENDLVRTQRQFYKFSFIAYALIALIVLGFLFSTILYSIYLRRNQMITIGDITFIFTTLVTCELFMWKCSWEMSQFIRAVGELKSAFKILQLPHSQPDVPDAQDYTITSGAINFNQVTFAYEKNKFVLNNFSLNIHAREKVGIIGSSGQGKSTLATLLLRYFYPQKGNITIDNRNIKHFRQEYLRQQITFIPQDTLLFHRTIQENIAYAKEDATDEMIYTACRKALLHDFILSLPQQYKTLVGERGVKLSGGQRQRIAIARAFLKPTSILILDEATSALDIDTEAEIQKTLEVLMADHRMTVLAIAHRLSTLQAMDRIIVIQQGKVVEQGSHKALMQKRGYYNRLWKKQINNFDCVC